VIFILGYLLGAAAMAHYLYRQTDRGRALLGTRRDIVAVAVVWVVAWPVFALLLVAVEALSRLDRIRAGR
jgi:hypothetical protein